MDVMDLHVVRLPHAAGIPWPTYATDGAAGMDLHAAPPGPITLAPFARMAVPTGLVVAIPSGYEAQVRARSGRALREGLTVLNGPGTIDSDYRGEVHVLLVNLGDAPVVIHRGDRIAQMVIAPVFRVRLVELPALDDTPRGPGGFGSTGR